MDDSIIVTPTPETGFKMQKFACRDNYTGALKPVMPGQTREELYCGACANGPHRSPNCLFSMQDVEPKRKGAR